jgi:hypothetical protein
VRQRVCRLAPRRGLATRGIEKFDSCVKVQVWEGVFGGGVRGHRVHDSLSKVVEVSSPLLCDKRSARGRPRCTEGQVLCPLARQTQSISYRL